MKFTFDEKYNIAYICFKKKKEHVESVKVSEDVIIDLAPDGSIYGIELLNAKEQIFKGKLSKLTLINETTGKHKEIQLPF